MRGTTIISVGLRNNLIIIVPKVIQKKWFLKIESSDK
jgi:hypothetical protein